MRVIRSTVLALALAAGTASFSTGPVLALPLGPAAGGTELAAQLDRAVPTIKVRRRGGLAAGIIGGMILGGIIASQRPYYYDYPPPYYHRAYRPYPYDPAIDYCLRRFKSYDPYSMTYLGYDGFRHPCP